MRLRAGPGFSVFLCVAMVLAWGAGHFALTRDSRAGSEDALVTAVDGDTIQLDGKVVQLYGIDAPELGQHCLHDGLWRTCGLSAAYELNKQLRLSRRHVKCLPANASGTSDEICFAGDVDVAQSLLTAGYVTANATADPNYRELEEKAREAGLGLWHSQFVAPSEWRQGKRLPDEPGPAVEDCPVKAVALSDGQRVYYVPTDDGYDSVTVDPANGDRRYCSDESARQAGWRRVGEAVGP
ncbi:MAG TPA: thermonuclease family protein [Kiloniellales bacterium]